MEVANVISIIFSVFPYAKLVGKYVIFQRLNRMDSLDQIDLVMSVQIPLFEIQRLQELLQSHLINVEEISQFDGLTPAIHRIGIFLQH